MGITTFHVQMDTYSTLIRATVVLMDVDTTCPTAAAPAAASAAAGAIAAPAAAEAVAAACLCPTALAPTAVARPSTALPPPPPADYYNEHHGIVSDILTGDLVFCEVHNYNASEMPTKLTGHESLTRHDG